MGSPLRRLWDFADLEGTRRRFQEELQRQASDEGRAEVLCQLARVAGLFAQLEGCLMATLFAVTLALIALRWWNGSLVASDADGGDAAHARDHYTAGSLKLLEHAIQS